MIFQTFEFSHKFSPNSILSLATYSTLSFFPRKCSLSLTKMNKILKQKKSTTRKEVESTWDFFFFKRSLSFLSFFVVYMEWELYQNVLPKKVSPLRADRQCSNNLYNIIFCIKAKTFILSSIRVQTHFRSKAAAFIINK